MTKSLNHKHVILGIVIIFATLLPFSAGVGAQGENGSDNDRSANVETRAEKLREQAEERLAQQAEKQEDRAEREQERVEARIQKCQERQQRIVDKVSGLQGRGVAFGQKLESFTTRVENFVAENNVVVEDYDQLLANVEAAQADLQEALTVAGTLRTAISCDDPDAVRVNVAAFQDAMTDVKEAAKNVVEELKTMARSVKVAAEEQLGEGEAESEEA